MASAVQKVKMAGWQRVVAWCAGAALCLWLVSTIFSPGRPTAATRPAQEVDAPATGPSAQRLLESSSDADAAHAAILQRFLQLYGSTPPRVSEIAVATGPQQSLLGDVDIPPNEPSETSDDTQLPAQFGRSDLPVATPYREPDQEGIAEGGQADLRAPEANGLNSDTVDPNAAAAVLGEEQTREEVAPLGASLELGNRAQYNYTAIDFQAPQEYVGGTKSLAQGVDGDVSSVKYDSSAQWWPGNRAQQQAGNMEPLQNIPQDAPTGYSRKSNEVSANVDGRWRDSETVEADGHSATQQQRSQERTVLIQPPSRNVYVPETIMWRNRQEYQPLIRSKNEGSLSQTREEIQQPVLYYSRSPEQFNQHVNYRDSPGVPGVSSNNIIYSKKFTASGADFDAGTPRNTQRYSAQETPDAQVGGQKLFGRKYLSVSEAADVYDGSTGVVHKANAAAEKKAAPQNTAEAENVLHATSSRLTDENSSNGNSYEVDKKVFNQDVRETSDHNNLQKVDKAEGNVLNKMKNDVEENPSVTKRQEEGRSVGEHVKSGEHSIQYKEAANVTNLKKENAIQKGSGVIRQKSDGMKGKLKCPDGDLLSVQDGGRLGNKVWEYAAVWALPRVLPQLNKTAVVPRSLLRALSKVFHNLTLPALEDLPEDCPARQRLEASEPVKRWRLEPMSRAVAAFSGRPLLLHRWIVLAEPVLARLGELRASEFRLRPELAAAAQRTLWDLRRRSGVPDRAPVTFVGVHVRRTDFSSWLPRVYNRSLAGSSSSSTAVSTPAPSSALRPAQSPELSPATQRALHTMQLPASTASPATSPPVQAASSSPSYATIASTPTHVSDASYFSAGMALCRARARLWRGGRALFAVTSDDPDWCEQHLAGGSTGGGRDVVVARGGSPEQDLALLAACNQSLVDYGTFGQWAALLAGGPAVALRLDPHVDRHLARLPGWTLA